MFNKEKLKDYLSNQRDDWDDEKVTRIADYLYEQIDRFIDNSVSPESVTQFLSEETVLTASHTVRVPQNDYFDVTDNKLIMTVLRVGDFNMEGSVANIPPKCLEDAKKRFMGKPLYFSYQRTEEDVMGYISDVSLVEDRIDVEVTFSEETEDFQELLNQSLIQSLDVSFKSTNVLYNEVYWVSDFDPVDISIMEYSLTSVEESSLNKRGLPEKSTITINMSELERIYAEYCVKATTKKNAEAVREFVVEKV